MASEMHEVRLVSLGQFRRDKVLAELPDEVHLHVNRRQRKPRLEYEQHAAVEEKARAYEARDDRNPVITRARDCHYSDCHAGRNEDAHGHVEDDHAALQQSRAARQLVQLAEDYHPPLLVKRHLLPGVGQLFQPVGKRAHAVYHAAKSRGGGENHSAAGGDEHGWRNHGRQDG